MSEKVTVDKVKALTASATELLETPAPDYQRFVFWPLTWLFGTAHRCPYDGSKLDRYASDLNPYGGGFALYVCRKPSCQYVHTNQVFGMPF